MFFFPADIKYTIDQYLLLHTIFYIYNKTKRQTYWYGADHSRVCVCVSTTQRKYARATSDPSLSCASKRGENTRGAPSANVYVQHRAHTGDRPGLKRRQEHGCRWQKQASGAVEATAQSQREPDAQPNPRTPAGLLPLRLPRFSCARSRAARGRGRDASKRGNRSGASASCVTGRRRGGGADPIDPGRLDQWINDPFTTRRLGQISLADDERNPPACASRLLRWLWLWLERSFGLVGEQQDRAAISGAGGHVLGFTCRRIAFGVFC